jgi:hypothetical protein
MAGGLKASTRPALSLEDIDDRVRFLQVHAIEESTCKNYITGARDYLRFCATHGLSIEPTPSTLARYIAYSSLFIASAPKYLSGARHFLAESFPEFEKNRSHPFVRTTIAGARKVRADPVRRKAPLRLSHLQKFESVAQQSGSYNDLLFITMLSCAFFACHRMGELVVRNEKALQDWRKVIKRGTLILNDR